MLLETCELFKHGCLNSLTTFLLPGKTSIWLLLHKVDHIINVFSSGIKFFYLTTENLSTLTENILQNFEEGSEAPVSDTNSLLVNTITEYHINMV